MVIYFIKNGDISETVVQDRETWLQWMTDRMLYVLCRIALLSMTSWDAEGHLSNFKDF